ncbi:photosystem II protein Psb27 [Gracilaria domingensis]|nr:photosystem II protein Psb27 [Gracilaria domingensis]
MGFYRGFVVNLMRTVPACMLTFTSYELVKRYAEQHNGRRRQLQMDPALDDAVSKRTRRTGLIIVLTPNLSLHIMAPNPAMVVVRRFAVFIAQPRGMCLMPPTAGTTKELLRAYIKKNKTQLSSARKCAINLGKLLRQPLLPLLRNGVTAAVGRVMPAQRVDGRVQRGEAGASGHLVIPSVQGHKIIHLLARLADLLGHAGCAATQVARGAHVAQYLRGVDLVVARHRRLAPECARRARQRQRRGREQRG